MLKQICTAFAFPLLALAQAPYASHKPMPEPIILGRGIISGGDFDSHPAFSPDGRTIYFVRSSPNFKFWTILCRNSKMDSGLSQKWRRSSANILKENHLLRGKANNF